MFVRVQTYCVDNFVQMRFSEDAAQILKYLYLFVFYKESLSIILLKFSAPSIFHVLAKFQNLAPVKNLQFFGNSIICKL